MTSNSLQMPKTGVGLLTRYSHLSNPLAQQFNGLPQS
jgi:hypothetical protein